MSSDITYTEKVPAAKIYEIIVSYDAERTFPWVWTAHERVDDGETFVQWACDANQFAHGNASTRWGAKIEAKRAIKRHIRRQTRRYVGIPRPF